MALFLFTVKAVIFPLIWIILNILCYLEIILFATDNMVMKKLLPNICTNLSSCESFKCTYKIRNYRIRRDRPPGRSADNSLIVPIQYSTHHPTKGEIMAFDKSLMAGSTGMLILKLLSREDMYGYQMIETLSALSDDTFSLKAGTLYPLLHNLEENGLVTCYEAQAGQARIRKYYSITKEGRKFLETKETEWQSFTQAVNKVLKGGVSYAY